MRGLNTMEQRSLGAILEAALHNVSHVEVASTKHDISKSVTKAKKNFLKNKNSDHVKTM